MKIICFTQCYNELDKGNLKRFFKYTKHLFDDYVIYDDCSTDGSYEYCCKFTKNIIKGKKNCFQNELKHKQELLNLALTLNPDFIFWLDIDELLSANTTRNILEKMCLLINQKDIDALSFTEINLWRSSTWHRIDNFYDIGVFVRLWKVKPGIKFNVEDGLHKSQYPCTIEKVIKLENYFVIHYGFSSEEILSRKFLTYRKNKQELYWLNRILYEEDISSILNNKSKKLFEKNGYSLNLKKVDKNLIYPDLYIENEPKPQIRTFKNALLKTFSYNFDKPKVSFVCLIYKSVKLLKFHYEQIKKYTDLSKHEFFYIANDANTDVIQYLKNNYIKHYVFNNTDEHKKEWYINNVYRAYNYSTKVAQGDYIVYLNSDMCYSENWFENLFNSLKNNTCVCSRLVESGRYKTGLYGINKNFGMKINEYKEKEFNNYVKFITEDTIKDSGLYMPLLIRKKDMINIGFYPEGNIKPKSDIWNPEYALKEEPCISGDKVLMEKLKEKGVIHKTTFNSIVYHFQEGEMRDVISKYEMNDFLVCNLINTEIKLPGFYNFKGKIHKKTKVVLSIHESYKFGIFNIVFINLDSKFEDFKDADMLICNDINVQIKFCQYEIKLVKSINDWINMLQYVNNNLVKRKKVILVNDYLKGMMNEKTLWDFMLDNIPELVGINKVLLDKLDKSNNSFNTKVENYINTFCSDHDLIIQNGTFFPLIKSDKPRVCLIQDNHRKIKIKNPIQEYNFKNSDFIVTNSKETTKYYNERKVHEIPLGVDSKLFNIKNKKLLKEKYNFLKYEKIGIFVGALNYVKGWNDIYNLIKNNKNIFWIIVTKHSDDELDCDNAKLFKQVSHTILSELYNCADFFIIGSKSETQCLAAIEACMCNTPIIMRNTGFVTDLTNGEINKVGIVTDDFQNALTEIYENKYSPREVVINKYSIKNMILKWKKLINII